jgi:hypothetical protein
LQVLRCLLACSGKGRLVGRLRGPHRQAPGQPGELFGEGFDEGGACSPASADDDELGVGQRDQGGQNAAGGLGQHGSDAPRLGAVTSDDLQ